MRVRKKNPAEAGSFFAPLYRRVTKNSALTLRTSTPYYIIRENCKSILIFGVKPGKRKSKISKAPEQTFILDEARKYQQFLQIDENLTRAELARKFKVSRARITQLLNILNLPPQIVSFLEEKKDNEKIQRFFTERRLRPLTWIEDPEIIIKEFEKLQRR